MSEDTGKKWDDSLISMGLGALVVVVSGILLFNYFNNQTPKLLQNQSQKSIAVSSAMPVDTAKNSVVSTSASGKTIAQATKTPAATPKATATVKATSTPAPTAKPTTTTTTTPKATATAIAKASPTVKATEAPKATQIAQATTAPAVGGADSKTLPATYTVQAGDSLWKLSEQFYGTGYEWKQIATANKLAGAYTIEKGQVLTVPKVEMISATSTEKSQVAQASPAATNKAQASTAPAVGGANVAPGNSTAATPTGAITYTVVPGDSLWSIAETKCNNGYAWSGIARQNNLVKPSVIHAGNVFTFTCS